MESYETQSQKSSEELTLDSTFFEAVTNAIKADAEGFIYVASAWPRAENRREVIETITAKRMADDPAIVAEAVIGKAKAEYAKPKASSPAERPNEGPAKPGNALLNAALEYARLGWAVIPLWEPIKQGVCACGNECGHVGKHPRGGRGGVYNASTNNNTILTWWQQRHPHANIGIATGKQSGIAVLDVDPRNGGDKTLAALEARHGPLPETMEAITGRGDGGGHRYFSCPQGIKSYADGGIELSGNGKLVVAPPSLHESGGRYRWKAGHAPGQIQIAPLPDWLLQYAHQVTQTPKVHTSRGVAVCTEESGRDNAVCTLIERSLPSRQGMRNRRIFDLARRLKFIAPISAEPESMRWAFDQWFEKALPVIGTKDPEISWKDFKIAWRQAKTPPGAFVQVVIDRTADAPDPPCAAKYKSPAMRRLIKLARELQRINGNKPFPLACRDAAKIGVSFKLAHRYLRELANYKNPNRVLELVEAGVPGTYSHKANMYRYIADDPPQPAANSWDPPSG